MVARSVWDAEVAGSNPVVHYIQRVIKEEKVPKYILVPIRPETGPNYRTDSYDQRHAATSKENARTAGERNL